ncbi:MAG: hypothetical protein JXR70_12125 [Spirochaetales bacterium]|nr:hypothetical protein [Spirochaetales bacterium]
MKNLNVTNKIKLLAGIVLLAVIACSLLVSLNPMIPLFNLQLCFSFLLLVLFSNLISAFVYQFIQKREQVNEIIE